MVMYDYDSNTILAEPIKNIHAATIRDAFLKIHKFLKAIASNPKVYIVDNNCSSDLKEATKKHKIDFQLDPPHMHRGNASERAIITCKNHFISRFSTKDTYLPMSKWD